MKKLTLFLAITVFTAVFLSSCTDAASIPAEETTVEKAPSGTRAYLNTPFQELYEKDWELTSTETKLITVYEGDNLWDISLECSGSSEYWKAIYYMNYLDFQDRLVDTDGRQDVWIFPGETLYVPADFNCSRVETLEDVEYFEYYVPTNLSVKLVETNPGLDAQEILILDTEPILDYVEPVGPAIGELVSPTTQEQPLQASVLPSRDLSRTIWGIAEILTGLTFIILMMMFLVWLVRRSFERTPRQRRPVLDTSTAEEETVADASFTVPELESFVAQAQVTGGSFTITKGGDIAKFEIPTLARETNITVVVENTVILNQEEGEKKKKDNDKK